MAADAQLFQVSGATPPDNACIDEPDEVLHQLLFCGRGCRIFGWGWGQRGKGAREGRGLAAAEEMEGIFLVIHTK